jgi:hypothetical protein
MLSLFNLSASAFPLSSTICLRRVGSWLTEEDFEQLAEHALEWITNNTRGQGRPTGNRRDALRQVWCPNPQQPQRVLDLLAYPSSVVFCEGNNGIERSKANPNEIAAVRQRFPLSLLHSTALASFVVKHGLQVPTAISDILPVAPELQRVITRGLADSHVHVGAAIPYEAIFLSCLVNCEGESRNAPSRAQLALDGREYRLIRLLDATKCSLSLLAAFLEDRVGQTFADFLSKHPELGPWLKANLLGEGFWESAVYAAERDLSNVPARDWELGNFLPRRGELAGRLVLDWLTDPQGAFLPAECMARLLSRLFEYYHRTPEDAVFASHLTQVVKVMCLLYRWIVPDQEGLEQFTEVCFARYRTLRSNVPLETEKAYPIRSTDILTYGLHHLNRQGLLRKAALRFSFPITRNRDTIGHRDVKEIFLNNLQAIHDYASEHQKTTGWKTDVMMPVTLLRRADESGCPSLDTEAKIQSRFQFAHLWKVIDQLTSFLSLCPTAARFFGAIDVAGNERKMANWAFALLFDEFRWRILHRKRNAWPKLPTFQFQHMFHAGESFDTAVQGLRRIWEILRFFPSGTHIGHGLALAVNPGVDEQEDQNAHELLDDLVWAWRLLSSLAPAYAVRSEIAGKIEGLSQRLYGSVQDAGDLFRAYEERFSLDRAIELGFLVPSADGVGHHYDGRVVLASLSSQMPAVRLLGRYMTHQAFDDVREPLDSYRDVLAAAYTYLRPVIQDTIVRNGTVVEACPTSNLVVGGLGKYENHPLFSFCPISQPSVRVTLNTDDPGLLGVTLEEEYMYTWEASGKHSKVFQARLEWLERIRAIGVDTFFPVSEGNGDLSIIRDCMDKIAASTEIPYN